MLFKKTATKQQSWYGALAFQIYERFRNPAVEKFEIFFFGGSFLAKWILDVLDFWTWLHHFEEQNNNNNTLNNKTKFDKANIKKRNEKKEKSPKASAVEVGNKINGSIISISNG